MWIFFCSVVLFVMIFPATLSVLLASRSLFSLAWNMTWFFIMSWFGQEVFGPQGVWVGGFFAVAYVYKIMVNPVPSVQFRMHHFKGVPTPPPSSSPATNENVIDVEYRHIKSNGVLSGNKE